MSDETQTPIDTDSIPDSLSSAVDTDDIESRLAEDSLDSVGRELGSQIGREIGARVGRELGPTVASDIRERKSLRTILRNAGRRLLTILVRTLKNVDLESSISKLGDVGRRVMAEDSIKEGVRTVLPGGLVDSTDEEADEATGTEEVEEAGEEDEAGDSDGIPDEVPGDVDLSAAEIQDLKEETYRELLETMSYRDLQSVAKDVGVKANLPQDEMTDRIVEAFSEEGKA